MSTTSRRFELLAVLLVALAPGAAWAQAASSAGDVLKLLRSGGHVIVFRHGAPHADQADTDPFNLDNVAKQRQLNDKGRADAKAVGEVFRNASVPIGKSYSSRFYRAVETARLIGGTEPQVTGTNTLIVTHKPNILDALGKDWFDIREGEASILKPEGRTYALVARVQIGQWATATK